MKKIVRRGYMMAVVGFLLMIATAYIGTVEKNFYMDALRIIMEPAGWFLVWTGLDNIIYRSRQTKPAFEFNSKMAHAEITFLTY